MPASCPPGFGAFRPSSSAPSADLRARDGVRAGQGGGQQGRREGALEPRHVVLRSRPLRRGDHGVRGRLPAEERSGVPVQPGAGLPEAGKHERAVHFYKTYLRYVPKAPNRADIEEKIKTEEQLAAHRRPERPRRRPPRPPPPPATTTPPPGQTDAAARRRRWPPSRRRPASCRPSRRSPPGYMPPATATTESIRAASSASRGWPPPARAR